VVSVLDQRPRGPGFESVGCGLPCSNRGPVALCTLGWAYSTLHPLGVGNEYRLQLGRYKAGTCTCDTAWCASCTWAPLWWPCLLGALYQVLDLFT